MTKARPLDGRLKRTAQTQHARKTICHIILFPVSRDASLQEPARLGALIPTLAKYARKAYWQHLSTTPSRASLPLPLPSRDALHRSV